jgi:multisubunit Na+/H+ antiporter MnhG subunit
VGAHLIGRAAYRSGMQLSSRTWTDHLHDDMEKKAKRNQP